MIIGIDASKAAKKNRTGVENYVYELILNLGKIDHENTYYLYTNATLPSELTKQRNFVEKKMGFRRFWNTVFLPLAVLLNKPEKLLQPADTVPWSAPKKTVAIVHDLASFVFPKAYSPSSHLRQIRSFKSYEDHAKKVICVSESTKKDYLHYFSKMKNKVAVVSLGYDSKLFRPIKNLTKEENPPYLFYSGRIEERKNIIRIVKAFSILKKEHRIPHKLILAGSPGYGFEHIIDFIKNNAEISGDIVMPGFIPYDEMPQMMAAADIFVSPTLYEGFGLSVLEAMACGAAVVTSNSSSMPEVVGGGALMCDPLDEKDIAEKIYKIISDDTFKSHLREEAVKRAAKFSWETTARETLNILESL